MDAGAGSRRRPFGPFDIIVAGRRRAAALRDSPEILAVPATIALQHHERIDGSGYPAGLRGDEILIESRIVNVADAYVAMTHDRAYRKAITRDEAFAELRRHGGTQFDNDVVAALIVLERLPAA